MMLEQRDPERRAIQVRALIRCAMMAEENETSGVDWKGTADVLGLAEELMDGIIDHFDFANRKGAPDEQAS